MPNVSRGDRMHGLTSYLVGPGRANEHTEPHLVAGDEALMAWHDDAELSAESAASIARHLDRPQRAYDVEVTGGHVWHCSLSLRAEEGAIGDEKWGEIARDFLSAMEFDDAEGTKAPMRWAAFHHGTSKAGNDHIHLVVNLVREDGTKASVHNDFRRAQKAARVLEQKHGLEQLESDGKYATRGYKAGEREVQARGRARARYERTATPESTPWDRLPKADREARVGVELRADHSRQSLARGVRAAATASGSEADFVRRVRQAGMLVRPRYADGRTDVITGFSVAERPQFGERPTWYGGYRLGNDLSLSRLRQNWPDTPQHATDAAGEWNAARRQRRVVGSVEGPTPDVLAKQGAQLEQMVDRLNRVPFSDRDTWSSVARDTAGAFAAWSRATESTPGDLAQISDALSRAAQTYRPTAPRRSTATEPLATTAMTMMAIARGGRGPASQTAMMHQMIRLATSLGEWAQAAGERRQAEHVLSDLRERATRIQARLPKGKEEHAVAPGTPDPPKTLDPELEEMKRRVQAGSARPATAAPLPNKIDPARRPTRPVLPNRDRGKER